MARQWIRQVKLQVGNDGSNIDLSNLRVRFNVGYNYRETPNFANIIVTNPSPQTANLVKKEYKSVVLQAGYPENVATIFQGEIVQVRYGRENPTDTYLNIIAKEGSRAYSYATISKTLSVGHTFRDQVNECLKALQPYGIVAGFIADLGTTKMPRGKAMFGMVRNQLRAICQATGTSWSIQGNKLQIVRDDRYIPGNAIVLNSRTGMVGMPVQTLNGVEVKCLLNPEIKPGRIVQINQSSIQEAQFTTNYLDVQNYTLPPISADGFYKVIMLTHSGDTRGNPFYTDFICLSAGNNMITRGVASSATNAWPDDN